MKPLPITTKDSTILSFLICDDEVIENDRLYNMLSENGKIVYNNIRNKEGNKNMKHYEVLLPVYKMGDDLGSAMAETQNDADALILYSKALDEASRRLRILAGRAKENGLQIFFTHDHYIEVIVDENVGDKLKEENILYDIPEFDEEETVA